MIEFKFKKIKERTKGPKQQPLEAIRSPISAHGP